ncbi:MAG TPA: aminotransferase class I/II-fold pyridoxal phosphate-dependent enzyme [Acidimicrobiales bacterium]|nr:aminotransferase class I/II-fold pyridoxal phosphate-dependent enzyme [Acidimicrobiales bacterium]
MRRPALAGGEPAFPDGLPFVRPAAPDLDRVAARLAPSYDRGVLTNGPLVRELEEAAAARLGVPHVVAVSSCTAGLMLAMQAVVEPGRAVVMPSFTFSATAHAAAWAGGRPRFVDCDEDDCLVDVAEVAAALADGDGDVPGALVATHVFGAPAHPERLDALAGAQGVPVVYDAAHAFGSCHRGRPVGGFGAAEVFSLSPTKPLVAGEGGLIATRDAGLAARLRAGRDYGNPGDYDTRFAGLNARQSELHAAVALCSLADFDEHLARRRALAAAYAAGVATVPGLRVQALAPDDESTWKDLTVIVDPDRFGVPRDLAVAALAAEGVGTRCYFDPPVHRQASHRVPGGPALPRTDRLAGAVVNLPIWPALPDAAVSAVVDLLGDIHDQAARLAAEEAACARS